MRTITIKKEKNYKINQIKIFITSWKRKNSKRNKFSNIPSITRRGIIHGRPIKNLTGRRGNSRNRAQEGMAGKKGNTWIGKILIIMLMSRCAGPKDVEGKGWPSTSEYLLSSLRWGWLHGGVWGWGWTFAYFYQYLASCACAPSSIPSDEPSRGPHVETAG